MNAFQMLRVALGALLRNKTRSFLTVLGIVIGVAAVIAMVGVGQGAKAQVEASYEAMGTNMLVIMPGSSMNGGVRGGSGSMPTLTWDDLQAIRQEIASVRYAVAQLRANAMVASANANWTTSVTGTAPDFFAMRNWSIGAGSLFLDSDVTSGAKVAVLGQTVAEELFGSAEAAVGQPIRIRNVPFQVVGVLASKGQSANGQDNDDAVFVPQTAFQAKLQRGLNRFLSGGIWVSLASEADLEPGQEQIAALLRERHRLGDDQEEDFSIRNLTEMANARQEGTKTMTMLLASIASVSLLVGGIGVMNIMLVSVTERTREIGLRMAIGAKPRDVLAQFLTEAIVLSLMGGLIGTALGVGVALLLGQQFGWPILIQPAIVAVAVAFSGLVGVGFGLYPARKAALLNPIEALRYE
ncbi:MAG TPA: ABC transporter permease [Stenomitos sp.]